MVAVGLAAPAGALAARDAYVADTAGGEILQLAVGATGALAPLVPPSLPATKPRRLAMTPDGRSLFVTAGRSGEGRVLQYDVSPTGLASPKAPLEIAAGELPVAMAADPAGRSSLRGRQGSVPPPAVHDRCRRAIARAGAPSTCTAAPKGVAVSPDGKNAYVIVGGWIKRFAVGADGRLDPDSLISVNTGGDLTDVALTPDGAHLFAASRDGRVFQFAVGGDGGPAGLTPAAAPAADGMPSALAIGPGGANLYVAAASSTGAEPQLLQYAIGAGGLLTPLTRPACPFPAPRCAISRSLPTAAASTSPGPNCISSISWPAGWRRPSLRRRWDCSAPPAWS